MFLNSLTDGMRALSFTDVSLAESKPCLDGNPCNASQYQSSSTSIDQEADNIITTVHKQIARALAQSDSKTLKKLMQVNQKRSLKGLPPIDLQKTTQDLEDIQNNASLSPNEKKKQIETLRKELGLSKGEMKSLFTKRLGSLYKEAEKSLARFEKAKQDQLKSQQNQAESLYGKNSPQARDIQSTLDSLQQRIDPEKQRLGESSQFYRSLYPGFFAKLGGFFKKIGGGFLRFLDGIASVLRFIPGIGPLASRVLNSVKYLFQGRIGKVFTNLGKGLLDTLKNWQDFLPLIPGLGTIASLAATGIGAVLKATRGGTRQL